ncbi:hypothetical protein EVAR_51104_1 [Eumeta japonica]|uniref:Uncharacterized protein n=1 Tax=Eumeta variegata TaxID=151549 RepID=A0A4C1XNF8_EUMVA|nr:hypothetical protein EVAR_51104_1 [Eumeta japonica]
MGTRNPKVLVRVLPVSWIGIGYLGRGDWPEGEERDESTVTLMDSRAECSNNNSTSNSNKGLVRRTQSCAYELRPPPAARCCVPTRR